MWYLRHVLNFQNSLVSLVILIWKYKKMIFFDRCLLPEPDCKYDLSDNLPAWVRSRTSILSPYEFQNVPVSSVNECKIFLDGKGNREESNKSIITKQAGILNQQTQKSTRANEIVLSFIFLPSYRQDESKREV